MPPCVTCTQSWLKVVFNHDLDQSNDDQFDTQHFKAMFQARAALQWVLYKINRIQ